MKRVKRTKTAPSVKLETNFKEYLVPGNETSTYDHNETVTYKYDAQISQTIRNQS